MATKARMSAISKARWQDPAGRARLMAGMQAFYAARRAAKQARSAPEVSSPEAQPPVLTQAEPHTPSRPSPGAVGGIAATNQELINAVVVERRRHRPPTRCATWMQTIRFELGESLLDLVCLLDEAEELSREPLPAPAHRLKVALVGFLELTPMRGQGQYKASP